MNRVYLDWNATAPLRPEARAAMLLAMDAVGNPSSVHAEGRAAKGIVELARRQVAALMGADAGDVVFTSGATEAAAMALPDLTAVLMSKVEHDAVFEAGGRAGGPHAAWLDVDADGRLTGTINGASLAEGLWDDVVALQAANSETGVLQDTLRWAQEVRDTARGTRVLVDAVQAWGKIPYCQAESGADYLMCSAHKFGGPKGVGALAMTKGAAAAPLLTGGGQEMGRRSGTENVIGIAGFGAAAEAAARDLADGVWDRVEKLRNILENTIAEAAPETIFVGNGAPRLPNTACFAVPGWKGETQVMQMDLAGFAISAGSACSSGKVRASRVLTAVGHDAAVAGSAIRVSLGPTTTEEEVARFCAAWLEKHETFRARAA